MKNKKIFRTLLTLCAALILMGGFSVTAYAQVPEGADDATDDSGVIYEEPEKEAPLTPDGNATLVDDFGGNKLASTPTLWCLVLYCQCYYFMNDLGPT